MTASRISMTRLFGHFASFSPLEDAMPSGGLESATQATVRVLSASSLSSKDTEPIRSPVPSATTTAMTRRLGGRGSRRMGRRSAGGAASGNGWTGHGGAG
jgi:hypothetical protein